MTMPMVTAHAVPNPAAAIVPNAAQPASSAAPIENDAVSASGFAAVLTLLLVHAGKANAPMSATAPTSREPADESAASEEESSDVEEVADGSGHSTTTILVAMGAEITALGGHQDGAAKSPIETAADAALDEASHNALGAALASSLVAGAPPIAITGDAIVAADAKTVRRELDLLAPEFRDRLERVIDRMESEFGYKVEVTETYRTQARQDSLYAQGRTEPGQVVTWTRTSNHTGGRAADLVIDGSYDDVLPYERLTRIAREEGLRTLGARDPGHVELSSSPTFASARGFAEDPSTRTPDVRSAIIARSAPSVASLPSIVPSHSELESPADDVAAGLSRTASRGDLRANLVANLAPSPGMAQVARVAGVPAVAQVAQVAQVARVAVIGAQVSAAVHAAAGTRSVESSSTRGATPGRAPANGSSAPASPASLSSPMLGAAFEAAQSNAGASAGEKRSPDEDRRPRPRVDSAAARNSAAEVLAQSRDELVRAVAGVDPTATSSSLVGSSDGSGGIAHADMSERIARLLKVQDAAADRPMSQMMLKLERPDGGVDRLRVDLRGNTISATLDAADQGTADRMGANVKELQRALEQHGFATDSVTVRTASRAVESSTLSRAAGASLESDLQRAVTTSPSNSSSNTSSRERGARHDEQRPSPDPQRQRSRREQKGER